jgi:hypothetical protein
MIKMKFTDVTAENTETVSIIKQTGIEVESVKVLTRGDTRIVFSLGEKHKHLSISNPIRKIKKSEIAYAINSKMKVNPFDVKFYISPSGIFHISWDHKL